MDNINYEEIIKQLADIASEKILALIINSNPNSNDREFMLRFVSVCLKNGVSESTILNIIMDLAASDPENNKKENE